MLVLCVADRGGGSEKREVERQLKLGRVGINNFRIYYSDISELISRRKREEEKRYRAMHISAGDVMNV